MSWRKFERNFGNQLYSKEDRPYLLTAENFKEPGFVPSWGIRNLDRLAKKENLSGLKLHIGIYSQNFEDLAKAYEIVARIVWRYEHSYPISAKFAGEYLAEVFSKPTERQRGKHITIYFPFSIDQSLRGLMKVMILLIDIALSKLNLPIQRISADPRYNFYISPDGYISVRASSDFYGKDYIQDNKERFGNPIEVARRLGLEEVLYDLRDTYLLSRVHTNQDFVNRYEVKRAIDENRFEDILNKFVAIPLDTSRGTSYHIFRIIGLTPDGRVEVIRHDGNLRNPEKKVCEISHISRSPLEKILSSPYYE